MDAWPVIVAIMAVSAPLAALPHEAPGASTQAPPASLPDGCAAQDGYLVCRWTLDTTMDPGTTFTWKIPPPARTLAHVTIEFNGQDMGWEQNVYGGKRLVSYAFHSPPQSVAPQSLAREMADHLLLSNGTESNWTFELDTHNFVVGAGNYNTVPSRSVGKFTITYVAQELPLGQAPARPAATRDAPQLSDAPFDAEQGGTDVVAVWFDDPSVGDGLFDLHMALRNLTDLKFASSSDVRDYVDFTVKGQQYEMIWKLVPDGAGVPQMTCWIGQQNGNNFLILTVPSCDMGMKNSTLTAIIPESVVGHPGVGEPFTNIDAGANDLSCDAAGFCSGNQDTAGGEQFAFALGGPEVWDKLNGCAFCPPRLPWYRDPLAAENIPNTLQVVGATVAVISFLGGIVLVRRNRRLTRELLSRVDALMERHGADAHQLMHALAELERDFTRLFHDGRINEAQYQMAVQRVVATASRLSLRRELEQERAVRVPVQSGPEPTPAMRVDER